MVSPIPRYPFTVQQRTRPSVNEPEEQVARADGAIAVEVVRAGGIGAPLHKQRQPVVASTRLPSYRASRSPGGECYNPASALGPRS